MKIIFMGTPDFALPALKKLAASHHEIIAVYTRPPKPAGRGYEVSKSKVHLLAEELAIPVFTPATLKDPKEQETFSALQADIAVVAAYGLLLPSAILQAPKYGCVNIHPSDLPRWRGAAPIQHTILSGDKTTAVCIMQLDEGMDTGDIILKQHLELTSQITAHELHDLSASIGGELLIKALELIDSGKAVATKQSTQGITHAGKLTKTDERIHWDKSAFAIYCQIKTFAPRPGAYFKYKNEIIKIIAAEYDDSEHALKPGTVVDDKLTIACQKGYLYPKLLQREGKKMIYLDAFLRGFAIPKDIVLE
jgi:methionyl-tRNA formyltransferase